MTYQYHPMKTAMSYKSCENVHYLTWSIPNFLAIADCSYIAQCETEYSTYVCVKQFKLRIEFIQDSMRVFFLYQKNIVIKEGSLYIINLLNKNDKMCITEINNYKVKANVWQPLSLLNKNVVTDVCNRCNGVLQLWFRCNIEKDKICDTINIPTKNLSNNLKDLFTSSMFSDVIMKSVDGFEFKLHKVILTSRSTVLKAHFLHDSLEDKTNIVETHLDKEVLNEVLTYIYTDTAPRVQEMPEKILEAAEFYNLSELKKLSEDVLYSRLTADNAIETLKLADLYSATSLQQSTLEFIKDGHVELLTKSDSWKSLNSPDIIKAIFEFIIK